jgi:hypothetical protein
MRSLQHGFDEMGRCAYSIVSSEKQHRGRKATLFFPRPQLALPARDFRVAKSAINSSTFRRTSAGACRSLAAARGEPAINRSLATRHLARLIHQRASGWLASVV